MSYQQIIDFWFNEIEPELWFKKDTQFDRLIKERFGQLHSAAVQGELYTWRERAEGRLAEIIILDQFSRNIYRDDARAFAYDGMALILAQEAVLSGEDQKLDIQKRGFLYMPYMHSESKMIHEQAVVLFNVKGLEYNYDFELKHKEIIDRFGRYPHRNDILNRVSTEEELAFLQQPGSGF